MQSARMGEQLHKAEGLSMKVTICIGSACHLKGSREIIQKMQELVKANGVSDKVDQGDAGFGCIQGCEG